MRTSRRISLPGPKASLTFCVLLIVLACVAHVGASLQAPLTAMPFSAIDGAIDAASGAERTGAGPGCAPMKLYAVRTATSLYLAVDVPEVMLDMDDVLLLYFDRNHNAGMNPDPADLAIRLSNFPAGLDQTPGVSLMYPGTGAGWGMPAAIPVAMAPKSSRSGGRLVVELTVPITMAPLGFALFYASKDFQDCDGDMDFSETTARWPAGLMVPGGDDQAGVKDPSQWDDLGLQAPLVTFNAPTCCTSSDITFEQSMVPMKQPFDVGQPVDIDAEVHNTDMTTTAKNVRVQITVHKFGTGGGVIFTAPVQEIMSIGPSAAATTGAVPQWTPAMAMHGCIRAEILPPVEGGGKSLDDYAVGANAQAQYNTDVACAMKGMVKRLQFTKFNPSKDKAQMINLVMRQRVPRGFEGLAFELEQPDGPLGPLQEANVALLVRVPENLPTTDLPRQVVHVPPTAGRDDAVLVQANPGDRLHIAATGDVDIDAGGTAPGTGPDGRDVSNVLKGRFLLAGESAGRVGGALIGSFDAFATSFLIGSAATLTVPQRAGELRLAIADLVDGKADNTGGGFDVEVWRLPALPEPGPAGAAAVAAAAQLPFPEVDIFATTTEQITIAGEPYTIFTNVGGVTYQILVTEPGAPPPGPVRRYLLWLLVLIALGIGVLIVLKRKRKTA